MTELYPGEEDFVLPAPPRPNPMPKPQSYVVEGFEDVVDAPVLHQPTSDMMPSGDWLKQRVLKRLQNAKALRQKAPMSRMSRWARKLANLRRRSMEWLVGGARRVVGVFLGGKRKRAPEACEPTESDRPVKRIRLEEEPVHVEEPMEVQEAGPAFIEGPDLADYADIGYGVEENEAANHVILGADDEFNGQNTEPEAIQLEEVDAPMDVAPVIPAPEPVVADHQALPEDGANDPQPIQPAARRPRGTRPKPFAVIQAAQGEGFEVSLLGNGTVKFEGIIPGFAEQSAFARKAANGGITIAAPFYSRFTDVSASATHVILRTSRGRIMVFGSNDHGQLGSKRRLRQTRLASQTLGSLMRSPLGMATLKVKSIEALGSESWAWDFEGRAYRCGTANDGSWVSAVFERSDTRDVHDP